MLLQANPRWGEGDEQVWQRPGVTERALEAARAVHGGAFHWLADDVSDTTGGRWWRNCLRGLTSPDRSYADLSTRVLALEFHGYHSPQWSALPITLPSQRYTFDLVRQAIDREAVIVALRALRSWQVAVPELMRYDRLCTPRSSGGPPSAVAT